MSVHGRVLTRHFEHEPKQHELFGLDLGEGPRRRVIILGAASLLLWGALWWLILGPPNKYSFSLYFLPPIILTMFGTRREGRRMLLTNWVLGLRYALIGHRPIVRAGIRSATRSEYLPFRERWHILRAVRNYLAPGAAAPPWADQDGDHDQDQQKPTGRPIILHQRARILGGDALLATLQRRNRKAT